MCAPYVRHLWLVRSADEEHFMAGEAEDVLRRAKQLTGTNFRAMERFGTVEIVDAPRVEQPSPDERSR